MYQQSVRKKIMGAKKAEESNVTRDCNTIAFHRSSTLHTVNARGSVTSLACGFSG